MQTSGSVLVNKSVNLADDSQDVDTTSSNREGIEVVDEGLVEVLEN